MESRPRPRTSLTRQRGTRLKAPNTLHIYSVIGNRQNSKLLPLKSFVLNMQWLVKSVSSSFSKDLSHEAKAKDSTLKAKTKDFKIVLEDSRGRGLVLENSNTVRVRIGLCQCGLGNWWIKQVKCMNSCLCGVVTYYRVHLLLMLALAFSMSFVQIFLRLLPRLFGFLWLFVLIYFSYTCLVLYQFQSEDNFNLHSTALNIFLVERSWKKYL